MFLKMLLIKLYTAVHKIYKQIEIWLIMLALINDLKSAF
ncbi:MAG: hypothetical protein K0S80_3729 [Neobacillus sp.]|nr:hypothetical protein [Neobacillus sp.]